MTEEGGGFKGAAALALGIWPGVVLARIPPCERGDRGAAATTYIALGFVSYDVLVELELGAVLAPPR
jgi:hypothetical protein